MKCSIVLIAILSTGCTNLPNVQDQNTNLNQEQKEKIQASKSYRCSKESMKRVEDEALFCIENTGYLGKYCYEAAIERICKKTGNK